MPVPVADCLRHRVAAARLLRLWVRIPNLLLDVVECGYVYARSEPVEQLPLKQ